MIPDSSNVYVCVQNVLIHIKYRAAYIICLWEISDWKCKQYFHHSSLHFFALSVPVPERVSDLKAASNGIRSLRVTWLPPAGEWERYYVVLYNQNVVLLNTTLEKNIKEYIIQDTELIPGRQYDITVVVESGGLTSKAYCKGRTGQPYLY